MQLLTKIIILCVLSRWSLFFADESDLSRLSLGEPWLNSVVIEDLVGHVVIVEMWGINCGSCRASIPHMIQLQEKHGPKGLLIVAPHRQTGKKAEIVAQLKRLKVNYAIYSTGSMQGDNSTGIPKAFVFDSTGKLKFEGNPADGKFGQTVEELMKVAPDWITGGKIYTKVKAEAKSIETRKNLGKTYAELKTKSETGDSETQTEAKELLSALDRFAKSELAKIEANKIDHPPEVIPAYKAFAKNWNDSEYGKQAEALATQLEKDESFKNELQAFAIVQKMEEPLDKYLMTKSEKKQKQILVSLLPQYQMLKQKYGETQIVKNLEETLKSMGVAF